MPLSELEKKYAARLGETSAPFKDFRHGQRLRETLQRLGSCVPQASQSASQSQSIYRFWGNPAIERVW